MFFVLRELRLNIYIQINMSIGDLSIHNLYLVSTNSEI